MNAILRLKQPNHGYWKGREISGAIFPELSY